MNEEIIRLKKLAGILTESVQAVPGIGTRRIPEETESEMQTQTTAAVNQGDAASAEAMDNVMATEEHDGVDEDQLLYAIGESKKMKSKNKAKEKRLKKKYDKSGMKKSMIKQYGKEEGEKIYFAKIRGEAMKEGIEPVDPYEYVDTDDNQGMLVDDLRDILETFQELAPVANERSILKYAVEALSTALADCRDYSGSSADIQNVCMALEEVIGDIESGQAQNVETVASVISDCIGSLSYEPSLEEQMFNNGYDTQMDANGQDYFPNGADSPVVDQTGAAGARQGDNPEQKSMRVIGEAAEIHRSLVYNYRKFLKEEDQKKN